MSVAVTGSSPLMDLMKLKALSILADGRVRINFVNTDKYFPSFIFGFYIDSSAGQDGGLWFSDTNLNSDDLDHMAAYQGKDIDRVQIAD